MARSADCDYITDKKNINFIFFDRLYVIIESICLGNKILIYTSDEQWYSRVR